MDDLCGWPLLQPLTPPKVMVMARWLARKAVIEDLKASGYKVQYMELATISEATEAYLRKRWRERLVRSSKTRRDRNRGGGSKSWRRACRERPCGRRAAQQ
jgi:hypothetical protein